MTADEIEQAIPDGLLKCTPIHTGSVREALRKADEHSKANSVILVTGSLYLVGEVKKLLSTRQAF
jgi:folylpolyglutamate synthase/dihydropteroate synthase